MADWYLTSSTPMSSKAFVPAFTVTLLMDLPASVKPTNTSSPMLLEVPASGTSIVCDEPSENVIVSWVKFWTPDKKAPKNWVGVAKVKVTLPPIISTNCEPPGVVLYPSKEGKAASGVFLMA